MKTIDNIVVIDRYNYDELVKKATFNDLEIEEKAKIISDSRDSVPVKISFNKWKNQKNFTAPIDFERGAESDKVYRVLDEIEPKIREWMDENMREFGKQLKEKYITERNCIALSKQVANLKEKVKLNKFKMVIMWAYAILITIVAYALWNHLQIR